MAKVAQSVTSLEESPEVERRRRFIKYTAAMIIRFVCVILAVTVQGWMMWVFAAGAIFLPYFAVVIANAQGSTSPGRNKAQPLAPTLKIDASEFTRATSQADR